MSDSRIYRRDFLKGAGALTAAAALGQGLDLLDPKVAGAVEDWKPNRPITVAIQFSAGGGTDTVTRNVLKNMESFLGVRIKAINVTGANGAKAAEFVWSKPSDGYTWIGAGGYSQQFRFMKLNPTVNWRDWQYYQSSVSLASWATHPDSPYKTFGDFVKAAKANPGKLKVSTDGEGGLWHEAMANVSSIAGFTFKNVPFDGGAPATLAALKNEVDIAGSGLHEQIEFVKAGKLRHLAAFTAGPITVEGAGTLHSVTEYIPATKALAPFGGDYCLALKRDTPLPVLVKVAKAVRFAVKQPSYKAMLKKRVMQEFVLVGKGCDKKGARLESQSGWLFQKLGIAKASPAEFGIPKPEDFEKWWPPKEYKPTVGLS
jgi:tripartite-type tricarboxylate transporter receptor subunit TctC